MGLEMCVCGCHNVEFTAKGHDYMKIRLSDHAHARLVERNIDLGNVKSTINAPEWKKTNEVVPFLCIKPSTAKRC